MPVEVYTECLPDLTPLELVKYSKLGLLSMAESPQIFRDRFAHVLTNIADEQVMASIELGDIDSFKCYSRAARFIHRNIERFGHGNNDFLENS